MSEILFDISHIMARRGQSVVLVRGSTPQPVQTVIVAPLSQQGPNLVAGAAGVAGTNRIVLIGYRSYPGQADFNVQRGDLFKIGTVQYRVTLVDDTLPGRREAQCEGVQ